MSKSHELKNSKTVIVWPVTASKDKTVDLLLCWGPWKYIQKSFDVLRPQSENH